MKRIHIIIHAVIVALLLAGIGAAWGFGLVTFFSPWWLLALLALPLVPLVAATGISGLPSRTNAFSMTLRSFLLILLAMCLADVQVVRRNDSLSVLFLLDHSASINDKVREQELLYVNATAAAKKKKDTAGVVVFGEDASVERMPGPHLRLERLDSFVGRDQTDIQGAIELAAAAFPADVRKKIVLITDGNQTRGDLLEGIKFAAGNRIVTDILPVSYEYDKEVLVEKVQVPDKVKQNETFDLKTHIYSLKSGPAELSIFRNGICMAREQVSLQPGRSAYSVAMKIEEPGFYSFAARVNTRFDTVVQNNEASGCIYIQGESRVLAVAPTDLEIMHLVKACREDNMEIDVITPEAFPNSLGGLQNHDCVILANVGADELSQGTHEMLRANVRDLGAGLVMIGGENSFGAGNYGGTPIEDALPVSMDIKEKKINPKGALVLILHTCEFADGNYWAKEISKKAIETVNSQDDVGVLLYDHSAGEKWLFKLQPAGDKRALYAKIDQAAPGDMPSFEPTMKMAYEALSKSDAMVRHMIVISDGDPATPSPQLIKDMAAAGITISTVGINPHSPRDVDVLKYIASQTGGRYYFAQDPSALPKIFIKEAKVVKRSLIFNKKFQPLLVLSTELTKGVREDELPPLMAYVATTPKPRTTTPIVSDNENHDPILAFWQFGLGKSAAFTSDASGNWGKHWVGWDKYGKIWTQVIRWCSRKREKSSLSIRTDVSGGRGKLLVDAVDDRGGFVNFLKLSGRIVNPDNEGVPLEIRQTSPGRYEADFDARKVGVHLINIGFSDPQTGKQGFSALGVSVPYSAEYHELKDNKALLRQAVASSGGRILSGDPKLDGVFESSLPPSRSFRSLWEALMGLALLVFFADVTVRRVIITRDDLRAAAVAARAYFAGRRARARQTDATMAALLERKKKTFEKVAPQAGGGDAPAPGRKDFKKTLDRMAGSSASGGVTADTAGAGERAARAERTAPQAVSPDRPPEKQAARQDADSYTGRLLAAKRRAQKDSKEE